MHFCQNGTSKPDGPHKRDDLGKSTGLIILQMVRPAREMLSLHVDYMELNNSYGEDMPVLVIASFRRKTALETRCRALP